MKQIKVETNIPKFILRFEPEKFIVKKQLDYFNSHLNKLESYINNFDPSKSHNLNFWGNDLIINYLVYYIGKQIFDKGFSVQCIKMRDLISIFRKYALNKIHDGKINTYLNCDFLIIENAFLDQDLRDSYEKKRGIDLDSLRSSFKGVDYYKIRNFYTSGNFQENMSIIYGVLKSREDLVTCFASIKKIRCTGKSFKLGIKSLLLKRGLDYYEVNDNDKK